MSESPPTPNFAQNPKTRSVAFAAFEDRHYVKLFTANSCIFFGLSGKVLVISLLAVRFVEIALPIAKVNFALSLPMCIGSIIAGAMVDRIERRKLMLLGLSVMIAAESFVCFKLYLGDLKFWQLVLATMVSGASFPFIMPAGTAMMYKLLGPHHVGSGMSMITGVMSLSRVISPWFTAILIQWVKFGGAYLSFVLLFVCAFVCVWNLPQSQPGQDQKLPLVKDILNGFRYLRQAPQVLVCLVFAMLPLLVVMAAQYFMVIFAKDVWKVGEQGVGTMMGAMGLGGIVGSFFVARLQSNSGHLQMMVAGAVICGLAFAMFSQAPFFFLGLFALVLANGGATACQTTGNVSLQLLVDDNIRGRVTSFTMMSFGLTPFIAFPVEIGVHQFGAPNTFLSLSVILLLIVMAFCLFSPHFRRLNDYIAQSFNKYGEQRESR